MLSGGEMMAFPKLVRNPKTPVHVTIAAAEPNEFNEAEILLDKDFLCNYQDSAATKYTADKQSLEVTGVVYIDGDILPGAAVVSSGHVRIFGEMRDIVACTKARNLDGSVNYTRLDVR
jgi:hypothetical protein